MQLNKYLSVLIVTLVLSFFSLSAQAKVIATIKPLHSITAFLLDGIESPILLIDGSISPHFFNLKPSQARLIRQSDLLVWAGENIEASLVKIIKSLNPEKQISYQLVTDKQNHNEHIHQNQHYWLDPIEQALLAERLYKKLQTIYPQQVKRLTENHNRLQQQLKELDTNIKKQLNNNQLITLGIHNALAHFNERYGINQIASLQKNAHQKPSIKHILELKKKVNNHPNVCLLIDKQNPEKWHKLLKNIGEYPTAKIDITGAYLTKGKNLYFELMQNLTQQLSQCQ